MTSAHAMSEWTPQSLRSALSLIAITDDLRDGIDGLLARSLAAERGGITMLQVRLKESSARELLRVSRTLVDALSVPVIVNDRLDIALLSGAAGAHLGMQDVPIALARTLTPPGFLLGASLGASHELADLDSSDYVGVGPIFTTPSKLDAGAALGIEGAASLARAAARPSVAIGGVDTVNAGALIQAGFDGVSVIRAVLSQQDPEAAARSMREAVESGRA